jgi:ABC-type transport system involved in multi-copper enzyme maturation permease subunit
LRRPLLGWSALLKADLSGLGKSWVLRGWLVALAISGVVGLAAVMGTRQSTPASGILAAYLISYLVIWSTVVIVLSAGAVSGESEIVADSLLSRSCTRNQYLMAKLTARSLVTVGIYLVFSTVAAICAWKYGARDVTVGTIVAAITIVGTAMLLLTSLGITLSVLLNNTITSVVGLLLLWYVAGPVFGFLGAPYLSPTSLAQSLPTLLRDYSAPQLLGCTATPTSLTLNFSKELDAVKAEQVGSYSITVQPPRVPDHPLDSRSKDVAEPARMDGYGELPAPELAIPTSAAYDREQGTVLLSGLSLPKGAEVKVVASGVTDSAGNTLSPAANRATTTLAGATPAKGSATKPDGSRSGQSKGKSGAEEPDKGRSEQKATANSSEPAKPVRASRVRVIGCTATSSSLKVSFSGALRAKEAEDLDRFVVESPLGLPCVPSTASYNQSSKTVTLTGLVLPQNQAVRVTVRDLHDPSGGLIPARFSSATYNPVTTWKYLAGFGIPALLLALLSLGLFSRRDL